MVMPRLTQEQRLRAINMIVAGPKQRAIAHHLRCYHSIITRLVCNVASLRDLLTIAICLDRAIRLGRLLNSFLTAAQETRKTPDRNNHEKACQLHNLVSRQTG